MGGFNKTRKISSKVRATLKLWHIAAIIKISDMCCRPFKFAIQIINVGLKKMPKIC